MSLQLSMMHVYSFLLKVLIYYREFGPKVLAPNSVIKGLPKLFEAKQVPVRDGVKKLAVSSISYLFVSALSVRILQNGLRTAYALL